MHSNRWVTQFTNAFQKRNIKRSSQEINANRVRCRNAVKEIGFVQPGFPEGFRGQYGC
jgi:hypothetical protein